VRSADSLENEFTLALRAWHTGWKAAGGFVAEAPKVVKTTLAKIERGGRMLHFKVGEAMHKSKVSGSRTQITIGGKPARRNKLKVGMNCAVTYGGNGSEAKLVACQ
jgi:uncharacterized Zn-binding protein involved in type VI secretion